MLAKSPVSLTGLGARDSLRLEAGLCLYGQDLDESTTPVEAGLTWVIGKERRSSGGFIGAEAVQKHIADGPPRRRIGMIVEGAPARRACGGSCSPGLPTYTILQ
jgi:aminomethyltransferase